MLSFEIKSWLQRTQLFRCHESIIVQGTNWFQVIKTLNISKHFTQNRDKRLGQHFYKSIDSTQTAGTIHKWYMPRSRPKQSKLSGNNSKNSDRIPQ